MKWLIDEMLPPATASELETLGHDAISVTGAGLGETADEVVYNHAVAGNRTIVTENFADFAKLAELRLARDELAVPNVFVRKQDFPRGRHLSVRLARHLHQWAMANPDPYPGPHWP